MTLLQPSKAHLLAAACALLNAKASLLASPFLSGLKKTTLLPALLFATLSLQAQEEDPGFAAAPQAPTASSFSTYVDIPVDAYTGIPNIQYPLFSLPTRSGNTSFDLALQYHPNNISHFNAASDVGLGWSLFGAGVISVAVVGDPDRRYNTRPSIPANATFDDEYYYNLPGQSGKFKINRDAATGAYSILNLKPNKLKFEFVNSAYPGLEIDSFTITDEKGMKYVFGNYGINTVTNVQLLNPVPMAYRSAFFLTKVYDTTGTEIANLQYEEVYFTTPSGSTIKSESVSKLKSITSPGIGKLEFSFGTNTSLEHTRNDISQLNSIVLKNTYGEAIKYCNFSYTMQNHQPKINRPDLVRFLSKFEIADKNNVPVEKFEFAYNLQTAAIHETDLYGFSKIIDTCNLDAIFGRNPQSAAHGVLESVTLPTGGQVKFDFEPHKVNYVDYVASNLSFENLNTDDNFNESLFTDQNTNTYTFQPSDQSWIYESNINPENRTYELIGEYDYDSHVGNASFPFTLTEPTELYVLFHGTPYPSEFLNDPLFIDYSIKKGSAVIESTVINDQCLKIRKFRLEAGTHSLNLISNYGGYGTYTFIKGKPAQPLRKWAYEGGLRIKKISHFADSGAAVASTSTAYAYEDFNDPYSSSGQLILEKVMDEENQQGKVFYKNVKITRGTDNGYTKLYYYTPYDKNPSSTGSSYDLWKYFTVLDDGLLNYSEVYDSQGRLLKKDKYYYEIAQANTLQYFYYSSRQGATNFYVNSDYIRKSYTKSDLYSYTPSATITEKSVTILDPTLLKPETVTKFTSDGSKERTDYYYAHELPGEPNTAALLAKNMVDGVLKTERFRNTDKLSEQKIIYKNWGGSLLAPELVQVSKAKEVLETKIRFNARDVLTGNPLEIQQENGMKISYIWGYNKTQLVAKIENIAYSAIPAGLITAIQTASDAVPYVEANLLTALENLRNAPELSAAQVSAYSHKLLLGSSIITDSKNDRIRYDYDDFGRLKSIYDRNGKLLSENEYHYKASPTDQNHIKTTTYKIETSSSLPMPTALQATQNITYFDGLGRPIQQRAHKQSGTGKDLVTPIVYDALGRQAKEYLPYPTTSASLAYDGNAENAALSYYASLPSPAVAGFETTANPFSQKLFEASPLNRVLKQAAPGDAWAMGSGHEVKTDYLANGTDEVKQYKASAGALANGYYPATLSQQGNYAIGELYKTVTKDENWTPASGNSHTAQEFKDKEGRVVLKRAFGSSIVGGSPSESWHDTYYVYDQFGNLTFVLPPLSDGSGSTQDLDGLCYQYRYDKRNRLVEKKLPGKDWELIVYDNLGRVIATGPALSPFSNLTGTGWLFTKYDALGRIAYTGWMPATVTSAERATLQAARDAQVSNLSEAKSASSTRVNGVAFRYTNTAWPTGTGWHVLTVSYYDDYDYIAAPTSFSDVEGQAVYYNLSVKPTGLPTGAWTRILETSALVKGETSYMLYDHKARPIRTWADNYLGGYTQADRKLDFSGKTLYTVATHRRAVTGTVMTVREDFTYSDQDRLLTHTHKVNSNPTELLAKNEYDERGQLVSKKVGGADLTGNAAFQKVDYAYTIRGWLKAINDTGSLTQTGAPLDLFSFKINYGQVENTTGYEVKPLYNGNIAETFWKTASDSHLRSYDYAYDALNRLNRAFYQKNGQATHSYNEDILYDKNGNIRSLNRNGGTDSHIAAQGIDVLSYTYDAQKPNLLRKVLDTSLSPQGFDDDSDGITDPDDDYAYDGFGNLTSDQNKGITSITYNHLNLPTKIVFGSESWKIEYLYAADGRKVRKDAPYASGSVAGGVGIMSMDYLGGFHYQGTALKFFPTAEGYVQATALKVGFAYSYVYNYTDHLGNIRLSYAQDPENPNALKIIEESHYYPFGLKHANYNSDQLAFKEKDPGPGLMLMAAAAAVDPVPQFAYNYKYNGKELQNELNLNVYDFGNRNYDSSIGRFLNMDRFTEKYYNLSPYQYGANNPIIFNDIKGDSIMIYSKQDKSYVKYDNGNLYSRNTKTGKWEPYNGKNLKVDKNGNKTIGGFLGKAIAALDQIRNGGNSGNDLISTLQNTSKNIMISEGLNASFGLSGKVNWNNSNEDSAGNSRPSYIGLAHELGHALDGLDGIMNDNSIGVIKGRNIPANEFFAMHWENKVRSENGLNLRENYGMGDNGQPVGQNINQLGQSLYFYNELTVPSVNLQTQYSSSGINLVPVTTGTTTILIPYQY
ncbi:RHS repeat-associated protein [Flavobacterium endophyticum]|uniref:RHS repeat-associated protein n=1 Tax=Flavobacterium endophyticum TaxID=1540163 RepID=A0A495MLC9_9FLAO|nr:DUF6443 domain-containing protein [Flavobacterium endophyticum]RKS26180.1 RHS repeat-associated protein [Flavobacterium endophyticum]